MAVRVQVPLRVHPYPTEKLFFFAKEYFLHTTNIFIHTVKQGLSDWNLIVFF